MKELRKIPKWGWITGGLAVAVLALWLYERHNSEDEEETSVCDPTSPEYDSTKCPQVESKPPGESTYGMGGATGSAAGGGMQYYYPYPSATEPSTTPPASTGTPEETGGGEESGGEYTGGGESGGIGEVAQVITTGGGVGGNGSAHKEPVHGETLVNPANTGWCGHPNAVATGNPCVNGGVGGHTPPSGWRLFCCNGMIGRAPEIVAVSPGRPAGGSGGGNGSGGGSGGGGGGAQCAQGTIDNINNARNQINRLQGEIDGLQNHIQQLTNVIGEHPRATQRGQWENERNQDRSNIDNKRGNISQFQQVIANGQGQPGCGGR